MSQTFHCDVCGVERTRDEGSGDWFTLGINEYGPVERRSRRLHIYAWPLGCQSKEDETVQHSCSVTHMLELTKRWAAAAELGTETATPEEK